MPEETQVEEITQVQEVVETQEPQAVEEVQPEPVAEVVEAPQPQPAKQENMKCYIFPAMGKKVFANSQEEAGKKLQTGQSFDINKK